MTDPDAQARRRILDTITRRAAHDPAFRRWLLDDPHGALSEVLGVVVPASFRIRFVEKDPDVDALIVLPDAPPPVEQPDEGEFDAATAGAGLLGLLGSLSIELN